MNQELNPDGLSDIAAVLDKSDDEQLWFFLNDSIPHEDNDVQLIFKPLAKLIKTGEIVDVIETTTFIAERLFFGNTSPEALESDGLTYMQPYIPLLKHCFRPYLWRMYALNLTKDQKQNLKALIKRTHCMGTITDLSNPETTGKFRKNAITVPVMFSIQFGEISKTANGWLYDPNDMLQSE